ncbi:MAG: hypothetical protein NTX25_14230 [Proteobacteria bacterium]|nr:hypothetical protein [Pseudomonadota bacterium]
MCIICLEFNKSKDLIDAQKMIEAARREVDSIPELHLKNIERELAKMDRDEPELLKIPS